MAENSALLPTDRWLLGVVKKGVGGNPGLQRSLGSFVATAFMGLAAATGLAAAFVLAPAASLTASLIGAVSAAGLMTAGYFGHKRLVHLKKNELPALIDHIKTAYLELKVSEIANSWTKRLDERKKEKPAATPGKHEPSLAGKFGAWAMKKALKKKAPAAPKAPPGLQI